MDALLAREIAAGEAAAAAQRHGGSSAKTGKASAIKKAVKKHASNAGSKPSAAAAPALEIADQYGFTQDDSDDEEDEEDKEFLIPDVVSDPASNADAEASVGRRIFLDSSGLTGTIMGWRGKGVWDIELDRGDERVHVRSSNLRA